MQKAERYAELADHWYVFLHAAKGIYTTLEQGSKATPQARQWFGLKNQERKNDPLLRYISEARNDDEHGIEENTEIRPSRLALGERKPGASRAMRDQFGNTFVDCGAAYEFEGGVPNRASMPILSPLDGKLVHSSFTPSRIALKPVRDRSLRCYPPPKFHLGRALQTDGPIEAAELTFTYLFGLVAEAESFHKP
jgi:hypothetical protein